MLRPSRWLVVFFLWLLHSSFSCTNSDPTNILRHFKRPVAMTSLSVPLSFCHSTGDVETTQFCFQSSECREGETCKLGSTKNYLFLVSADLDKLSIVDIYNRKILYDPRKSQAGVLYLPTGRQPIDVVSSVDKKQLYILHGQAGNILVYDLAKLEPAQKDGQKIEFPKDCKANYTCFQNPVKMVAIDVKGKTQLWVATAGDQSSHVLDMDPDSAKWGSILQTIRLQGTPGTIFLSNQKDFVIATNATGNQIAKIDVQTGKAEFLDVETFTFRGSTTLEDRFLYLTDLKNSGIRLYDLANKKVISQGDARFPELKNLQLFSNTSILLTSPDSTFLNIAPFSFERKKSDGTFTTISGMIASSTDGHVYLLDSQSHKVMALSSEPPSAIDIRLIIPDGTQRDPVTLPSIPTNELKLIANQTRSENWKFTYEGKVVTSSTGEWLDKTKGILRDNNGLVLTDFAKIGDQVFLGETCDAETKQNEKKEMCVFSITSISGSELTLELNNTPLPSETVFVYNVRTVGSYVVQGSVSGVLKERIQENEVFKTHFFEVKIQSGSNPTPRDSSFEFSTQSGFVAEKVDVGGQAVPMISLLDQPTCEKDLCKENRCKSHPNCVQKNCNESDNLCANNEVCNLTTGKCIGKKRIWVLDPIRDRLQVIETMDELKLDITIQ